MRAVDPHVRERLWALGVEDDEIDRAAREGWLLVLVVERMLLPGPRYSGDDVDAMADTQPDLTDRLWRAMGFPNTRGAREFTDADVAALALVVRRAGLFGDIDSIVQQSRVAQAAMARVAESWTDVLQRQLESFELSPDAAARVVLDELNLDEVLGLYEYVLRRQIVAAVRRRFRFAGEHEEEIPLTVGFVDLVGFTSLSLQVSSNQVAEIVARFEEISFDAVAASSGRVVKTIGDEVMFVADRPGDAAEIALTIAETHAADEGLPDVRAGLACGDVMPFEGDYYGPTVNLASRVVSVARRGTIVVSDEVRATLRDDDRFALVEIRRRTLKDIGPVRLWALRRGARRS